MDPVSVVSIIEATAAGVKACTTITKAIHNFVKEVQNVNSATIKIKREVESLDRTLKAVQLGVERFESLPRRPGASLEQDILIAVDGSVADCNGSLKTLINIFGYVRGTKEPSGRVLASTQQAMRLHSQRRELDECRLEIEQHKLNLNLSLNIVIFTVCSELSAGTERPGQPQEDPLLKLINKLRFALDKLSTPSKDHPVETTSRTMLKNTAKHVLKNSVYGGSRDGSVSMSLYGDSLAGDNEFVESWVHRLDEIEQEDTLDYESYSTSSNSQALTDEDDRPVTSNDSNASMMGQSPRMKHSIKLNLIRSLIRDGTKKYDLGDHVQASTCFNKALDHSSKLDHESLKSLDLTPVYFTLGTICLDKEDFDKAEENFRKLIDERGLDDSEPILTSYLKLGEVCYERNDTARHDLDNALSYCEMAADKFAEKFGATCENYYKATSLMAKVFIRQGSTEEAEALLHDVPQEYKAQERPPPPNSSPKPPKYSRIESEPQPRTRRMFSGFRNSSGSIDQGINTKLYPVSTDSSLMEIPSPRRKPSELAGFDSARANIEQEPQGLLESGGFTGDYDANKALIWAIKNGYDRVVNLLLHGYKIRARKKFSTSEQSFDKRADPNGTSKGQQTPLMLAITYNKVTIARSLIGFHAALDKADSSGQTPLSVASERGHAEILRLFPNQLIKSACHTTGVLNPLHAAAINNRTEVVQLFLEAGANPDCRDSFGATPLKHAAGKGHAAVVEILLSYGANPAIADNHSNTPLMAAVRSGDIDTTSYLTTFSPSCQSVLNTKNHRGECAILIAVQQNRREAVILLLHAGADLEVADLNGWTPLIAACENGQTEIVTFLLRSGANYNAMSLKGSTPLDHAQVRKRAAVEEVLRSRIPDVKNGSRQVLVNSREKSNPWNGYSL